MFEQLTQLVQQFGGDAVVNNSAVPNEHNEAVMNEASSSIMSGLKNIISETDGLMPIRYQKMLLGILDFETATVEDIMTPRNEIVGIDLEASIEEIVGQIRNSPYTQLVVYKNSIDRVVGFLHLRKVLMFVGQDDFDKQSIINLLNKPAFIFLPPSSLPDPKLK